MKQPNLRSRWMLVLLATLVLGIFFRVTHIDRKVYWHDEVFTSIRASGYVEEEIVAQAFSGLPIAPSDLLQYQKLTPDRGWRETWHALTTHPEHPPLYYLLSRLWMEGFGSNPTATRSLSVLFSLLAFPALYWLCQELLGSAEVGWTAIALFAVSPFHLLYAQEARQSSLWTLVILLSTALLLRALRRQTWADWGLYALTVALSLYTFLLSVLLLLCHGLIVLLARPFVGRSLQRFLLALGMGVIAFVPWLRVMIQNQSEMQSKTLWMKASPPKSLLIKFWGLHFSSDFVDLGLSLDHFYTYAVPPLILILLGVSLWVLCRHQPFQTWLPVVLLIGVPAIALMLPDLLLGGQRSITTRYFAPTLIGVQLAVSYLLMDWMRHSSYWKRHLGRGLLALLLTVGVISCSLSWQAKAWWSKGVSSANVEVAEFLNQLPQPTVISSLGDTTLGNVISLSYLLNEEARLQLVVEPNIPKLVGGGDRFLFHPSEQLIQRLQDAYSLKPEPIAQYKGGLLRLVDF
ncbi:MAG TPA: glycosyltransferase family 39 protein [Coleofasciculaceae cyanobacterium]